ncbi:MAG: hypothetical protein DMG40_18540 [Acidobacteria bacterium]|nr:MAG: hypothetical protein DMG40_18540 [Acidobacteriota bacterium]
MEQSSNPKDRTINYGESQDVRPISAETRGGVGWWKRKWQFIIVPQHSNALVAVFSALLFLATVVYTVFAAFQWSEMKNATQASQRAAIAAKDSADLARKQMEGLVAAIVDIPGGVSVDFPVPPFGEARANLINSGHVLAHDIHLTLSVTIRKTDEDFAAVRRTILSKAETVPTIPPTTSTRPGFIYPFELTQSEFTQVMNTESYIITEGILDYENGFDSRIKLPFCYAYIWGGQVFGRWTGDCGQAQSQIHLAKKLAKQ